MAHDSMIVAGIDTGKMWLDVACHPSGQALRVGNGPAGHRRLADWLAQHGDEFGLCQIYANERWHFELRPAAVANGCPLMYDDPTADPRTQR